MSSCAPTRRSRSARCLAMGELGEQACLPVGLHGVVKAGAIGLSTCVLVLAA